MKKRIKKFIGEHKGEISLFVIILVATLLVALFTSIFGAEELTKIALSVSGGIIALMGIEWVEDKLYMRLTANKRPAVLAIIIGVIIILI